MNCLLERNKHHGANQKGKLKDEIIFDETEILMSVERKFT